MNNPLRPAWDALPAIARAHASVGLILCLDYDGTLAPFPKTPDDRLMSAEVRATLARLAEHCRLAVLSGRGVANIRAIIGLNSLIFCGNYGMEIEFGGEPALSHHVGREFEAIVRAATEALLQHLGSIGGLYVWNKGRSIAVLHPNMGKSESAELVGLVRRVIKLHPGLKVIPGATHIDVRPELDWHKGHAIHWLRDALGPAKTLPNLIFISDDVTDEGAMTVLGEKDGGILVAEAPRPTAARHRLKDHHDVGHFLASLESALAQSRWPR